MRVARRRRGRRRHRYEFRFLPRRLFLPSLSRFSRTPQPHSGRIAVHIKHSYFGLFLLVRGAPPQAVLLSQSASRAFSLPPTLNTSRRRQSDQVSRQCGFRLPPMSLCVEHWQSLSPRTESPHYPCFVATCRATIAGASARQEPNLKTERVKQTANYRRDSARSSAASYATSPPRLPSAASACVRTWRPSLFSAPAPFCPGLSLILVTWRTAAVRTGLLQLVLARVRRRQRGRFLSEVSLRIGPLAKAVQALSQQERWTPHSAPTASGRQMTRFRAPQPQVSVLWQASVSEPLAMLCWPPCNLNREKISSLV